MEASIVKINAIDLTIAIAAVGSAWINGSLLSRTAAFTNLLLSDLVPLQVWAQQLMASIKVQQTHFISFVKPTVNRLFVISAHFQCQSLSQSCAFVPR